MNGDRKRSGKKGSSTSAASQVAHADKGGDRSTEQLKQMGKKLGNEELQQRIQKGNATRDELMDFLRNRLGNMREVQKREIGMSDGRSSREHWRQISDQQKTEYTNPDPTRWREAARLYEQAAFQLARGALGRGTQLVDKAMTEERKTLEATSAVVRIREEEKQGLDEGPACGTEIAPNEACGVTDIPTEVRELARAIQRVTEKPPEIPGRRRVRDPWWTEEEEEEEEEEGNAGAG